MNATANDSNGINSGLIQFNHDADKHGNTNKTPANIGHVNSDPVDQMTHAAIDEITENLGDTVSNSADGISHVHKANSIKTFQEEISTYMEVALKDKYYVGDFDMNNHSETNVSNLIQQCSTNITSRGRSDMVIGSISGRSAFVVLDKSGCDINSTYNGSNSNKRQKKERSHRKKSKHSEERKLSSKYAHAQSFHGYLSSIRLHLIKSIRYCIMRNIKTDIYHVCSRIQNYNDKVKAVEKYDPVPLVVISRKMVNTYLSFDNCVILNNPRLDGQSMKDICYDAQPKFVGKNLQKFKLDFMQYGRGIKLYSVTNSRAAILVSLSNLQPILDKSKKNFLKIIIPDYNVTDIEDENEFEDRYVLIMFCRTERAFKSSETYKWTAETTKAIQENLTVNMSGTHKKNKHFGCRGKYYGFGLISKYGLQDNLSISDFAGNNLDDPNKSSIIRMLLRTINYTMKRNNSFLPMVTFCGFSLVSALMKVAMTHTVECDDLNKIINKYERNSMNFIPISNWICKNAETLEFHQEYDSSYTMISMPYWERSKLHNKKHDPNPPGPGGTANFIFKWTSSDENNREHRYFPLMMTEGLTILFSGYGCYHRQHRTNNKDIWNYATYQNRSFYHKMRMSIIRCLIN